jgi:Fe2+ transport system protein B
VDPTALSGFLSREISRAGALLQEVNSSTRGLTNLGRLLQQYGQTLTLQHYSLAAHVLGEFVARNEGAREVRAADLCDSFFIHIIFYIFIYFLYMYFLFI